MAFQSLGLHEVLLDAVCDKQFTTPTPIQMRAIPPALAGRDVLGCAQTGTGKTAAFALPILHRLGRKGRDRGPRPVRSLILAPTRELAAQIGQSFEDFARRTGLRHAVIFGGVNQTPQCAAVRRGVDILVATPGRLLDLLGQRKIDLRHVEILVLDEADRMLDMGFIHDIKRIVALVPAARQTMLFSATVPAEIERLAGTLMDNPVRVSVDPQAPAADTVEQEVHFIDRKDKLALLHAMLTGGAIAKALVFTRTKHGADKVARKLSRADVPAAAMHSNKSQNQRTRTLEGFKSGDLRVLVASDIASRGIDVSDISHVVNYDLPHEAETYVHRIGRTGRAGQRGQAVSFCSEDERPLLRQIERLLSQRLKVARKLAPRPLPVSSAPRTGEGRGRQRRRKPVATGGGNGKRQSRRPRSRRRPSQGRCSGN